MDPYHTRSWRLDPQDWLVGSFWILKDMVKSVSHLGPKSAQCDKHFRTRITQPTDDRADKRQSRETKEQTGGREDCSAVLIVDFWSKCSCVFLDTRKFWIFPGVANLQLKTVRSFQIF